MIKNLQLLQGAKDAKIDLQIFATEVAILQSL